MSHKKWLLWSLAILLSPFTVVALLNYIVDPMWCFSHENRFNSKQITIIDREQKTNYLTYRYAPYDAVLIGNSRVKVMNPNDFSGFSVFNYAVDAMVASEYDEYIRYAQKVTSNHINTVFIGLSFASANSQLTEAMQGTPEYYIKKAIAPCNRLRTVLNASLLKFSWRTLKFNLVNDTKVHLIHDRHNVMRVNTLDKINRETYFTKNLNEYRTYYKSAFQYDAGFKTKLRLVKEQNPGVRIVAFTTPVSKPMHCLIREAGFIPEYDQWIRDIVEIFGELHHFEYIHSIAENYEDNFIDANHYLPKIGTLMVHRLQGRTVGLPDNFGVLINRDNLEQQLAFLNGNFNACR